jgi:hypothetical protein
VEITTIQKHKRNQGFGQWRAYVMGEDGYGFWLFTPRGSLFRAWDTAGKKIWEGEVGQGNREAGVATIQLITHDAWWIASWRADDSNPKISVDICTPPTLTNGQWVYTDLELDPIAHQNGGVEIEDEDEFTLACDAGIITPAEALAARTAADSVAAMLRRKEEPFGHIGWTKIEEALSLSLLPLTEL